MLNANLFTAGWGITVNNPEQYPPTYPMHSKYLMAVNISVVPMDTCNATMFCNGPFPEGAFCAGDMNDGRDASKV